jgi:two-component system, cell cycle sensor histidine kinase and response regulator CckA
MRKAQRTALLLPAVLLLAVLLFIMDLLAPLGVAVWLPYLGVVLLAVWLPNRRHTYLATAVCTLFTACGLLFSPPGEAPWWAVVNRGLAVATFWVAAIAGLAARRTAELEKANAALQEEIAHRKKLEAQLLRTQRLESVGVLAGGIAHDFNNLLTPVLMAAKLLREDRPEEDRQHLLGTLQASAERGAEVVRQLLSFAGGIEGARVPVQLRHVLKEVKGIVEHTFPKAIVVRTRLAGDLRPALADATQLSQVLMNLCVNARDAMPDGGTLTIASENVELDEAAARAHPDARPGPHVRITVEDPGPGIPDEVLDRVFDPFFTTKEPGKGTGLGLATALGIVKSHGGFIQVWSEVGRGSRFEVYLPAHVAPVETVEPAPGEAPDGNGELILVVDDEPFILQTVRATLERHGYRVVTAADGREALQAHERHRAGIDAVLLDMMMPGMDGLDVLAALRERDPGLRVIASSGLRLQDRVNEAASAGARRFLPKPYTDEQLLSALAGVLRSVISDQSSVITDH